MIIIHAFEYRLLAEFNATGFHFTAVNVDENEDGVLDENSD